MFANRTVSSGNKIKINRKHKQSDQQPKILTNNKKWKRDIKWKKEENQTDKYKKNCNK